MTSDETPDMWGKTPSDYAASAAGNSMLAGARATAASRRRPIGGLLTGETRVDPAMRDRLATALSESEAAKRSGDPDRIAYAEFALDQAIEASRTSRAAAEQARDEHGQFAPSFDGGIRSPVGGRPGRPKPGVREESSNALFKRLIETHRAENRELQREQTIHARGIASTIRHNR